MVADARMWFESDGDRGGARSSGGSARRDALELFEAGLVGPALIDLAEAMASDLRALEDMLRADGLILDDRHEDDGLGNAEGEPA